MHWSMRRRDTFRPRSQVKELVARITAATGRPAPARTRMDHIPGAAYLGSLAVAA